MVSVNVPLSSSTRIVAARCGFGLGPFGPASPPDVVGQRTVLAQQCPLGPAGQGEGDRLHDRALARTVLSDEHPGRADRFGVLPDRAVRLGHTRIAGVRSIVVVEPLEPVRLRQHPVGCVGELDIDVFDGLEVAYLDPHDVGHQLIGGDGGRCRRLAVERDRPDRTELLVAGIADRRPGVGQFREHVDAGIDDRIGARAE